MLYFWFGKLCPVFLLTLHQGVTNIKFWYERIFVYNYIKKWYEGISEYIPIKNGTNEYPKIFVSENIRIYKYICIQVFMSGFRFGVRCWILDLWLNRKLIIYTNIRHTLLYTSTSVDVGHKYCSWIKNHNMIMIMLIMMTPTMMMITIARWRSQHVLRSMCAWQKFSGETMELISKFETMGLVSKSGTLFSCMNVLISIRTDHDGSICGHIFHCSLFTGTTL